MRDYETLELLWKELVHGGNGWSCETFTASRRKRDGGTRVARMLRAIRWAGEGMSWQCTPRAQLRLNIGHDISTSKRLSQLAFMIVTVKPRDWQHKIESAVDGLYAFIPSHVRDETRELLKELGMGYKQYVSVQEYHAHTRTSNKHLATPLTSNLEQAASGEAGETFPGTLELLLTPKWVDSKSGIEGIIKTLVDIAESKDGDFYVGVDCEWGDVRAICQENSIRIEDSVQNRHTRRQTRKARTDCSRVVEILQISSATHIWIVDVGKATIERSENCSDTQQYRNALQLLLKSLFHPVQKIATNPALKKLQVLGFAFKSDLNKLKQIEPSLQYEAIVDVQVKLPTSTSSKCQTLPFSSFQQF